MRLYQLFALVVPVTLLATALGLPFSQVTAPEAPEPAQESSCELVILADPDDPYYPLAEEIAAAENALIAHTLLDAIAYHPIFLLWVVSPDFLSEAILVEFGLTMQGRSSAVSSGILTGSSLGQAQALWKRGSQAWGENFFAVNAPNPAAHIYEGRILAMTQNQVIVQPLTRTGFLDALRSADYLTFTGHGGSSYLRLDESTKITSAVIPALDSVIVATGSCQTLQPWNPGSISLKFVDQGAAAYAGFTFSPNEGYLIGEFDGFPFRYTWPDFPIGHVIQIQSRGALQGYAHFPYLHLLGDPRIALQAEPPYQLVQDQQEGRWRVLRFVNVPSGAIPVRIANGADYHFIKVEGITAAADQDPFYNGKLQMVNIGEDKFILLVHPGGELIVKMRTQAPWGWFVADLLLDSLDYTYIFTQQSDGDILAIGFALLPLLWTGWQVFKRRIPWQTMRTALALGAGAGILQIAYVLTRLDKITITSKTVVFSPLSILASFLLVVFGSLIFFQARSWRCRIVGLLVITFISWATAIGGLLLITVINQFSSIPKMDTSLWNHAPGLLSLGSFFLTFIFSGFVLEYVLPRTSRDCR